MKLTINITTEENREQLNTLFDKMANQKPIKIQDLIDCEKDFIMSQMDCKKDIQRTGRSLIFNGIESITLELK